MRKSLLLTILLIGFLTFSLSHTAEAADWSKAVKITSIQVSNVNVAGVWLTFAPAPGHTCAAKSGEWMLGGGDANIKEMTSIATTALVNSRTVTVYWGGTCSSGGYPILLGLTLK